jgi:UDP-glucose 4-epimerase
LKVLITGSGGFVGCSLAERLINEKVDLTLLYRKTCFPKMLNTTQKCIEISPDTDFFDVLKGVDVVIHLAARVHHINDYSIDSIKDYRLSNLDSTINLAKQSAASGVTRFVFISSIKVNGESTSNESKFFADDKPDPKDSYGLSKYEAEVALKKLAEETGMEIVIIRPPLIYGPKVKANFAIMMNWLNKDLPLPLGLIKNSRSLVGLENLVDLIVTCISHPKKI